MNKIDFFGVMLVLVIVTATIDAGTLLPALGDSDETTTQNPHSLTCDYLDEIMSQESNGRWSDGCTNCICENGYANCDIEDDCRETTTEGGLGTLATLDTLATLGDLRRREPSDDIDFDRRRANLDVARRQASLNAARRHLAEAD